MLTLTCTGRARINGLITIKTHGEAANEWGVWEHTQEVCNSLLSREERNLGQKGNVLFTIYVFLEILLNAGDMCKHINIFWLIFKQKFHTGRGMEQPFSREEPPKITEF